MVEIILKALFSCTSGRKLTKKIKQEKLPIDSDELYSAYKHHSSHVRSQAVILSDTKDQDPKSE
jgi:hypothetical protein